VGLRIIREQQRGASIVVAGIRSEIILSQACHTVCAGCGGAADDSGAAAGSQRRDSAGGGARRSHAGGGEADAARQGGQPRTAAGDAHAEELPLTSSCYPGALRSCFYEKGYLASPRKRGGGKSCSMLHPLRSAPGGAALCGCVPRLVWMCAKAVTGRQRNAVSGKAGDCFQLVELTLSFCVACSSRRPS